VSKKEVVYITDEYLSFVFKTMEEFFSEIKEPLPEYEKEPGYKHLQGLCEQVKFYYYPTIFDKAAFLFIHLCQSQFFSNGNKRIAVVITLFFLSINGYRIKSQKEVLSDKQLSNFFKKNKILLEMLSNKRNYIIIYSSLFYYFAKLAAYHLPKTKNIPIKECENRFSGIFEKICTAYK
jgi:death-on-curing family protein